MKRILIVLLLIFSFSCTENQMVKTWGGKSEIILEQNSKLENISWKENALWILVSDRPDSIAPKSYRYFSKKDGLFEQDGEITIKER